MKTYLIKKRIQAKSIKDATKRENESEILSVELEEKDEPQVNTHAIGFHVSPDYLETESYDPNP